MIWVFAALALAQSPSKGGVTPESFIQAGRYRMAISVFHSQLSRNPDNMAARAGLVHARGLMGRCDLALDGLEEIWASDGWTPGAAAGEGACAFHAGDYSRAIAAYDEAVAMDPELVIGWIGLARSAAAVGDQPTLTRALDGLFRQERARHAYQMMRVELAQRYGLESLEEELRILDEDLGSERARGSAILTYAEMDAREWLRLGDPEAALDSLETVQAFRLTDPNYGALRGEAARRLGWSEFADALFESHKLERALKPEARLLRARWQVDRGELAEAEAVLDATAGLVPETWLATRWYLARARGEDTAAWREAWALVATPGSGPLETLIPDE